MYLYKVDYTTNTFIHASIFSYNEVMRRLELASVAKQTYQGDDEGHENIVFRYKDVYVCHTNAETTTLFATIKNLNISHVCLLF